MSDRQENQGTVEGAPGDIQEVADISFEDHDARLNRELRRFDRDRAGHLGAEFPHDESYAPGYHAGGVRFGFFSLKGEPAAEPPAAPIEHKGPESKAGENG
jgi:hypothetical protein